MQYIVGEILLDVPETGRGDIERQNLPWGLKSPVLAAGAEAPSRVLVTELDEGEVRVDITEDYMPRMAYLGRATRNRQGNQLSYDLLGYRLMVASGL